MLPSGVVSLSCVQLNGAYAHSIPTLNTFLSDVSAVSEVFTSVSDVFVSDEPHPVNVDIAITPVSTNANNFLLFIICSSLNANVKPTFCFSRVSKKTLEISFSQSVFADRQYSILSFSSFQLSSCTI